MRTGALVTMFVLAPLGAWADVIDDFDGYDIGPLSVVSGGLWKPWMMDSTDHQVTPDGLSSPNAVRSDGINTPDNVAFTSRSLLRHEGAVAEFSFDFFVSEQGPHDLRGAVIHLGCGDPSLASINYDTGITEFILDWYDEAGTDVHVWDRGPDGGGDYGVVEAARGLPTGVWHHVELVAAQTVPDMGANDPMEADGYFDVFVNGDLGVGNLPFEIADAVGWNAIEIWTLDDEDAQDDYMLFDNISMTGEPYCEGDANVDGTVDPLDSGYVQARFGCPVNSGDPECDAADVNADGVVDPLDVGYVLARFGVCP